MTQDSTANNPYFALDPPPIAPGDWYTVADLADDRELLRRKVAASADALGTNDLRVAASVDHLGTCARVVGPLLHFVHSHDAAPEVAPERLWWQPARPGPFRLAAELVPAGPATPAAVLDSVVRTVLAPLVRSYGAAFAVSSRVLWGNAASGLDGARQALRSAAVDDLVRGVLEMGELAGTAARLPPEFRRNSCCLLYRLPGRGLCGDCVLTARAR